MIAFALVLSSFLAAVSQDARIVIPAGSPEDKELAAIAAEGDAAKRAEAYEEFIKKYSDNKPAVAYAEWQLSQDYLTAHDNAKALEWGDKALENFPNDLDIVVSDCQRGHGNEGQWQDCRVCRQGRCRVSIHCATDQAG